MNFNKFGKIFSNVGLLGGTFNPAHLGHLHISKDALNRFGFDCIVWIPSLQNSLKLELAPNIKSRLKQCKQIIDSKKIVVLDIESEINSNKTIDVVNFLYSKFPSKNYFWIMGSDNVVNFDKWDNWTGILNKIKLIVYDRPYFLYKTIKHTINPVLIKCKKNRDDFFASKAPGWMLVESCALDVSSTQIRENNERTK